MLLLLSDSFAPTSCSLTSDNLLLSRLCTNAASTVMPSRVVFLTDVAGVYTSSPVKEKQNSDSPAVLIPQIYIDTQRTICYRLENTGQDTGAGQGHRAQQAFIHTGSRDHDVTGGV